MVECGNQPKALTNKKTQSNRANLRIDFNAHLFNWILKSEENQNFVEL